MRTLPLTTIIAFSAIALACSKDKVDPIGSPVQQKIAQVFCESYWEFRCRQITRCDCEVSDFAACLDASTGFCEAQVLENLNGLDVEFDSQASDDCKRDLESSSACEPILEVPNSCARIARFVSVCSDGLGCGVEGVCVGGECSEPASLGEACGPVPCERGLRCDKDRCVAPGIEGADCETHSGCETGLACHTNRCQRSLGLGGSCGDGAPCGPNLRCVDQFCEDVTETCDPGTEASCGVFASCRVLQKRECRAVSRPGAMCDETSQCGPGYWCSGGSCELAAGSGLPCSDGVWCAPGLACSFPEFVCGEIPGLGESCALTEFGPSLCGDALGCVGGFCAEMPVEGQACTTDSRCADPWGCSFERDGSFCRVRVGTGEPCENDQTCESGTFCNFRDNRCAPVFALGAECSLGNECGRSRSCLPSGGRFICSDLPGDGQLCLDACADGLECVSLELPARCIADVCVPPGN